VIADLPVLARILDHADAPAHKNTFLSALAERGQLVEGCTRGFEERLRYALDYLVTQGLARSIQLGPFSGWVWNSVGLSDEEWKVRAFDPPTTQRIPRRNTPRAADVGIQVLSRLMSFAVDQGLIRFNPCFGIDVLYSGDRSEIIWEPRDLEKLEAVASPEVMWAARLAILTGLRQDDCRTLKWSEVKELAIEKPTGKSRKNGEAQGRRVALIPLYAELRELLAEIPKRSTQVLTNTRGQPWRTGLSDSFADAAKAAGVNKHFHDLRGTAATKLYLADFPMREIAEMMGWEEDSVERIINRYVRRDAMLRDRIARLDRTRTEQKV
jgi:integrase